MKHSQYIPITEMKTADELFRVFMNCARYDYDEADLIAASFRLVQYIHEALGAKEKVIIALLACSHVAKQARWGVTMLEGLIARSDPDYRCVWGAVRELGSTSHAREVAVEKIGTESLPLSDRYKQVFRIVRYLKLQM